MYIKTIAKVLFSEFQFSWISWFTKSTKYYNAQRNTKFLYNYFLTSMKNKFRNTRTNEVSLNIIFLRSLSFYIIVKKKKLGNNTLLCCSRHLCSTIIKLYYEGTWRKPPDASQWLSSALCHGKESNSRIQ